MGMRWDFTAESTDLFSLRIVLAKIDVSRMPYEPRKCISHIGTSQTVIVYANFSIT